MESRRTEEMAEAGRLGVGDETNDKTKGATMEKANDGDINGATGAGCPRHGLGHNHWWLELLDGSDCCDDEESIQEAGGLLSRMLGQPGLDDAMAVAEANGLCRASRVLFAAGARHPLTIAIIKAVQGDDAFELRRLLDSVPPDRWTDPAWEGKGFNIDDALMLAVRGGHENVVRLLMERGMCDMDFALEEAASQGMLGVVRLLVDMGADPRRRGEQAMILAVRQGHGEVAKHLAGLGCDVWKAIGEAVEMPARLF